jgi:hypothetical protein
MDLKWLLFPRLACFSEGRRVSMVRLFNPTPRFDQYVV